ncbi:MAG: tRNA (adenosine(37)-N6)-dimethylallyltransferase MiaA, partial [Candidatus Omnitrophota bacterium]
AGPTAIGKSEVAVELAKRLHSQVISCDSMQIYKGMDIITSKPGSSLKNRVKHHLIGSVSCDREYNVSRYRREAIGIIKKLIKRGKIPVFCGGTGLYVSILVDGIFKGSRGNLALRKKFYRLADSYGNDYLYRRLKRIDKNAADKIHPNDIKRIIRALEVYVTSGKPISVLQQERKGLSSDYDVRIFCLNMDRDFLYQRIDRRVDKMFKGGLLKEVKKLLSKKLSKTAQGAIGIKELKGYFKGEYSLQEALRLMKRNTRHYAKRQLSWFKKDKRIRWVNVKEDEKPLQIAKRISNFI